MVLYTFDPHAVGRGRSRCIHGVYVNGALAVKCRRPVHPASRFSNQSRAGSDQGAIMKTFVVSSLLIAALCTPLVALDKPTVKERSITKLADGVYEIRHPDAPDGFPNSNTTVVIGDKGVLVVDSCLLPSQAKLDIAQIKQWTTKPVLYVVNTHWHFDHTLGNATYLAAFPAAQIVAQRA